MIIDEHDALVATASGKRGRDAVSATHDRDQVDIVGRCRTLHFAHLDPVVLGHLRCVDVGHRLVAHRSEETLQHRQRHDACVVASDLALCAHFQRRWGVPDERREQTADALGQRQEWTKRLVRFGSIHVDSERHEVTG